MCLSRAVNCVLFVFLEHVLFYLILVVSSIIVNFLERLLWNVKPYQLLHLI